MSPEPPSPEEAEKYLVTLTDGLVAVGKLTEKVGELDRHVKISEATAKDAAKAAGAAQRATGTARRATKIAVGFAVLALVATGLAFFSIRQSCLSANSGRAASRNLWSVLLSAQDPSHATAKQRAQAQLFANYVNASYRPHSCWNLWKSYPAPTKPDLRAP